MSENLVVQNSGLGKLCSTCHGIFNKWDEVIRGLQPRAFTDISHYDDPRMWIASADDGCVFCFRILDNLRGGAEALKALRQSLALGIELKMKSQICPLSIYGV
jgi:hypothetical protein